jgi:hypothetical protein
MLGNPLVSVWQARTVIMVGFRFGNEQGRHLRVPFPWRHGGHSLRDNSGWIQAGGAMSAAQWR